MQKFAKANPQASKDEIETEKEARTTARFSAADALKQKWYDQPVKDVLVAFIICGAPGLDIPVLTADASSEVVTKGKRGRRAMRELENTPSTANTGSGSSALSATSVPSEKVALKKRAIELYTHNTRKNDLELFMRQLQASGLEHTEDYKKCDDELFALLRTSVFSETSAPTNQPAPVAISYHSNRTMLSPSFATATSDEDADDDDKDEQLDLQEQGN